MRFQRLDLNLLVALDALLTEQNVSVAADRVCIGQSAMSGSLQRLRDYFGDELLVIKGRRMVLTPRAESLIGPVRKVLMEIKTTITTRPDFSPATCDREIAILASDYIMTVLLPGALSRIAAQAPDIRFNLVQLDHHPLERLERGDVDLLITLDSAISPDHPSQPLFVDDYVVLAWAGNPLIGDEMDAQTYLGLGHVSVQFGLQRRPAFEEEVLQNFKARRRVEVRTPSFTSVPGLIVGSNRIATVHRRLAEQAARHAPLKLLPIPFAFPQIHEFAQWHQSNRNDDALLWIVEQIRLEAEATQPSSGDLRTRGGAAVA